MSGVSKLSVKWLCKLRALAMRRQFLRRHARPACEFSCESVSGCVSCSHMRS